MCKHDLDVVDGDVVLGDLVVRGDVQTSPCGRRWGCCTPGRCCAWRCADLTLRSSMGMLYSGTLLCVAMCRPHLAVVDGDVVLRDAAVRGDGQTSPCGRRWGCCTPGRCCAWRCADLTLRSSMGMLYSGTLLCVAMCRPHLAVVDGDVVLGDAVLRGDVLLDLILDQVLGVGTAGPLHQQLVPVARGDHEHAQALAAFPSLEDLHHDNLSLTANANTDQLKQWLKLKVRVQIG